MAQHPVTHEMLGYKLDELTKDVQEMKLSVDALTKRTNDLDGGMRRDKSFIAGALFIITGLWMAMSSFKGIVAKLLDN